MEPGFRDRYLVSAYRQFGNKVTSLAVGLGSTRQSCVGAGYCHIGTGNHRPVWIGDGALDATPKRLRRSQDGKAKNQCWQKEALHLGSPLGRICCMSPGPALGWAASIRRHRFQRQQKDLPCLTISNRKPKL